MKSNYYAKKKCFKIISKSDKLQNLRIISISMFDISQFIPNAVYILISISCIFVMLIIDKTVIFQLEYTSNGLTLRISKQWF